MGAANDKENIRKDNRTVPPPSNFQAIRSLLEPFETDQHTLDRTLKGFLHYSNLKGLEYRLRIAGVYTLEDLAYTDEIKLSQHGGFTRLMARRLLMALDDYLESDGDIVETSITQTSHTSAKRRSLYRASTLLRSQKNYGRMNVKRSNSSGGSKKSSRPLSLRLPDEILEKEEGAFVVLTDRCDSPISIHSIKGDVDLTDNNAAIHIIDENYVSIEEIPIERIDVNPDDQVSLLPLNAEINQAQMLLQEPAANIERSLSLPAGLHQVHYEQSISEHHQISYTSCPSLVYEDVLYQEPLDDPISSHLSLLGSPSSNTDEITCALLALLSAIKKKDHYFSTNENLTAISNITTIINERLQEIELVEVGCKVLKYMTYQLVLSEVTFHGNTSTYLLTSKCIIKCFQQFVDNRQVHLNGCLVLANLLRLDSALGDLLVEDQILAIFVSSLDAFIDDDMVCLSLMNALSSLVAKTQNARQMLLSNFQHIFTQTAAVISKHYQHEHLLIYSLSFITLSLVEVGALLDHLVMRDLIKEVTSCFSKHMRNEHVIMWSCKALSQLIPHEVAQEELMTESITNCFFTVLSEYQKSSRIQMWASYGLYQQVTYNSSLLPLIQDTGIITQCQKSLPHLSRDAQSYLRNLTEMATL